MAGDQTTVDVGRRERLREVWRRFAVDYCRGYSPMYEQICFAVADDDAVLDLALAAPAVGRQPNVLLAAVHYLVLEEASEEPLAPVYVAGAVAGDRVGAMFCELVLRRRDEVAGVLATRHTNTNECGRSAVLVPALRWATARVGEPIALLDVGASAGLNLLLDRYVLDYGPLGTTGPAASPVRITCDAGTAADGVPIASAAPLIAARVGLDRDPGDVTDEDARRWMLACVWPDTGRLDRTRAAIDLAATDPPHVVGGDMVDDLARVAATLPADLPLCVVTSWVLAYLRPERRPHFRDVLRSLGRDRPVAWISAEVQGVVEGVAVDASTLARRPDQSDPSILACGLYRGGDEELHVLGVCHQHGGWLRWSASAA